MEIRFTEEMEKRIDINLGEKKKANPVSGKVIGIGINIKDSLGGATVFKDNWGICTVNELSRMIEELTMLKEAIQEETGIIL